MIDTPFDSLQNLVLGSEFNPNTTTANNLRTRLLAALQGLGLGSGALYFSDNSTLTIANTVAETTLLTVPVTAGLLGSANGLKVYLAGTILNNTGGVQSMSWRIKFGATTLWGATSANFGAGATPFPFVGEFSLFNTAVAAQRLSGWIAHWINAGAILAGFGPYNTWSAATSAQYGAFYGTSAENSAGTLNLVVTVQLSAASANFTVDRTMSNATLILAP